MNDTDDSTREIIAALLFVLGIVLACVEAATMWPRFLAVGVLTLALVVIQGGSRD